MLHLHIFIVPTMDSPAAWFCAGANLSYFSIFLVQKCTRKRTAILLICKNGLDIQQV